MAVVYQEKGETIVFPQDEVAVRVGGKKLVVKGTEVWYVTVSEVEGIVFVSGWCEGNFYFLAVEGTEPPARLWTNSKAVELA